MTTPLDAPNLLLAAALAYAARGWRVFPLVPRGKVPLASLAPHGFKDATTDEAAIHEWWRREPNANVGIATGRDSGVDVLDVDVKHDGRRTLADHEAEHGYIETLTVTTGTGGQHLYFVHQEGVRNSAGRLAGIDVRGGGGYVVAPPSIHPNGNPYRWDDGSCAGTAPVAAWPTSLLAALAAERVAPAREGGNGTSSNYGTAALRGLVAEVAAAREGTRDDTRNRAVHRAGRLVEAGHLAEAEALEALAGACVANGLEAEHGAAEVRKRNEAGIAAGRASGPAAPAAGETQRKRNTPRAGEGESPGASRVVVVRIADVVREEVRWLWYPRIPRRRLTLVEGDPGLGKSFLTTRLVGAVTRGHGLPDSAGEPVGPANVLILTAEDGLGDTVRPRLEAAGADLARVFAVTGVAVANGKGGEREFPISLVNVTALGEAMEQHRPALVVVDPVQAYLGAGVDMNAANEVREVLAGLARLVEQHDAAAVLVRHLAKATGGNKLVYRGLGSIDFTGAARSILHVTVHPEDEEDRGRRVVFHVKANLTPKAQPLGFRLDGSGFTWEGPVNAREGAVRDVEGRAARGRTKSDRGRPADQREKAESFLRAFLSGGPRPTQEVLARGEDAGHSDRTLRRAFAVLGGLTTGGQKGRPGTWSLPQPDATPHGPEPATSTDDEESGNLANRPQAGKDEPSVRLPESQESLDLTGFRCVGCGSRDSWSGSTGEPRCTICRPPGAETGAG